MASLIFAASYLTYNKIKTKREERKEKKRKAYAARYSELEREHKRGAEEKQLQEWQRTMDGNNAHVEMPTSPARSADARGRRISNSESLRSDGEEKRDGPSTWVDEVLRERSGGVMEGTRGSGREETKGQSLV